jgi:ketosteroid isomerase-like protein
MPLHRRRLRSAAAMVLLAGLGACAKPEPSVDVAKETAAIDAEIAAINAAVKARDPAGAVAYDAADMISYGPGAIIKGKDADLAANKAAFADPAYAFSIAADRTEIARSGELAFQTGSYQQSDTNPATHKIERSFGEWVATYRKDADGTWKIAAVAASPGPTPPAKP